MSDVEIVRARHPEDRAAVERLMREYVESFGVDRGSGTSRRNARAWGDGAPPANAILLARRRAAVEGDDLGCVAMRRLDERAVEVKRLYI